MAITYKQIAEIVGVSRGTVDRALNNRGRIDPKVRDRILAVAEEYGFQPNHAGRALARAKNPVKIGVIVHLSNIPFFQAVLSGIEKAKADIANLGGTILIEEIPELDVDQEIAAIERLMAQDIQGLAITPIEDDRLRQCLLSLKQEHDLPIVTFNTDLANSGRMCFVGMDNYRSGRAAAGLMNILLSNQKRKILILSGYASNQANSQRVDAFVQELAANHPNLEISGIHFNRDREDTAYQITRAALASFPDIDAIYMVSSGQAGTSRALIDSGLAGKVRLIVFDSTPDNIKYLQEGIVDFIIDQDAFTQGNLPPHILFDYLFNHAQPENEMLFTNVNIKTKHTV